MDPLSIVATALALSMDALAVFVSNGFIIKRLQFLERDSRGSALRALSGRHAGSGMGRLAHVP